MASSIKLNEFLYKRSAIYLIAFFGVAVLAFWNSYYSILGQKMTFYIHFHGIFMTLWVLLLIAQAYLIRIKKYNIHNALGKASYLIFPILILSTFLLIHDTIRKSDVVDMGTYFSTALMINGTLVLVIIYSLGIFYRKDRLTHARYMICTIFPLFTPLTDRIIYKYVQGLIQFAPTAEGMPLVPFYGYAMADLLVIGLAIWDWRVHKRKGVFLIVLGLLLCYHISFFTFYKFHFWQTFSAWFYTLNIT